MPDQPTGGSSWTKIAGVLAVIPIVLAVAWPWIPALGVSVLGPSRGTSFPPSPIPFTRSAPVGPEAESPPWTTNVQVVDFNRDGLEDVLVCDGRFNRILLWKATSAGQFEQVVLAEDLVAPAHATVVDLDQDGALDLVVSVLGSLMPDDERIGRVVWLRKVDQGFEKSILIDRCFRVADCQPGDLDGDGDLDLAVAAFGYARGELLWLENDGQAQFTPHTVMTAAGAIHVPVADFDGDGDLDLCTVFSQDREEVWGFENDGKGNFAPRRLFGSLNYDLGSAGLVRVDLDRDGDQDLLLPVGDNLEDIHSAPQPYHGCFWLENAGNWTFHEHRIATLGGTYAADAGDIDGDGDLDVALVSMFNDWDRPGHASLAWLENQGDQTFKAWQVASKPTHLVTVACKDLNGDGRADLVTGGLNLTAPFADDQPAAIWITGQGKMP